MTAMAWNDAAHDRSPSAPGGRVDADDGCAKRKAVNGSGGADCRRRAELLRAALDASRPSIAPQAVHSALDEPGNPLDKATRAYFESRLGCDLSAVRVHTNERAAASALAVGARAYTVGHQIAFGPGQYAPHSRAGRSLLAHELVHVTQHPGDIGAPAALTVSSPDDPVERQAHQRAELVINGAAVSWEQAPVAATPVQLRRYLGPPGSEEIARQLARKALPVLGRRLIWRQFWRVVARRFATRAAVAAALALVDGPLPVGDLIALGLTLWTIWEIAEAFDQLWHEAQQQAEVQPAPQPAPQPQEAPAPSPESLAEPAHEEEGPGVQVGQETKERRPRPSAYPLCWTDVLPPPVTRDGRVWTRFERTRSARDEQEAAQARMLLDWRAFRQPDFDPNRLHMHHVVPLFLGGPDNFAINGIALQRRIHLRGHHILRYQPQMRTPPPPLLPLPEDLYAHPIGTPYKLVGYKGQPGCPHGGEAEETEPAMGTT
jgi:hypothetical protein